jgi:hypothetical protein
MADDRHRCFPARNPFVYASRVDEVSHFCPLIVVFDLIVGSMGELRQEMHRDLQKHFMLSPNDPRGPFNAFLLFLARVILAHERGCQAFIDVQGLDIVIYAYLNGNTEFLDYTLASAWNEALELLSVLPQTLGHPLLVLFPRKVNTSLETMIRSRCVARRSVWRGLDRECVMMRLRSWEYERHTLFGLRDITIPTTAMFDTLLDLLEFLQ